ADEVQRRRRMQIARDEEVRVRRARRAVERRSVDEITEVAGKLDAIARFRRLRARLRILTCEPPNTDDRALHAPDEHDRHLDEDLQLGRDLFPLAVVQRLGAVAALEEETLALLRLRDELLQLLDFPRRDEGRQASQLLQDAFERFLVVVADGLSDRLRTPALEI